MIGNLKPEEIEEVLSGNIVGRIGCHYQGRTYIVPINYAYDGQDIHAISREGMKLKMMRHNPQVCFEVDDIRNPANWKSVILWGTFEELNDPEQRAAGLDAMRQKPLSLIASITNHQNPTWPFMNTDEQALEKIVFSIHPDSKTGRFESNEHAPLFIS